ncbi:MAG: cupredoxin family copper-binding protein [Candidatus Acidiferrales bacterium]
MKKTMLKVVVCAVVVAVAGWAAGSRTRLFGVAMAPSATAAANGPVEVKIDNYSFMPGDLTVAAGTTVTWVNHDDVPHTVRSVDGAIKSKALDTDDKFSMTFDKPGTYEYFCSVHPKMTAKVIVK